METFTRGGHAALRFIAVLAIGVVAIVGACKRPETSPAPVAGVPPLSVAPRAAPATVKPKSSPVVVKPNPFMGPSDGGCLADAGCIVVDSDGKPDAAGGWVA